MLRRLALLVATYRYEDVGLRQLNAPGHDAEALAAVLRDPEIAGFDVTILVNEPRQVVGRAIGEFYRNRRRDDLTLLYFTGHGVKGEDGRLYLAMTDTERESLLFTALSADQINDAMDSCSSRQKILVLDCCYSGAFPASRTSKADPEVHTLKRFQGKGRVVLTASDSTQYSFEGQYPFEGNEISGAGTRSVFTRFLVEGLTTGKADLDSDGDITLDELYSYVHDRVVEEMPQQRPKKQENVEGRIVIARNVHWSLPAYLRHAIESPIAKDRLAVLDGLAHLHRIGNDLVRTVVVDHVRRLVDDDSKAVSAVAAKLITTLNTEEAQREFKELARQDAEGWEAVEKQVISSAPALPINDDTTAMNNRLADHGTVPQPQNPRATRTAPVRLWHRRRAALISSAALVIVVAVGAIALTQWVASPQSNKPTLGAPTSTPEPAGFTKVDDPPGVVPPILAGVHPFGVAVTPNGSFAYITNSGSDTVSVIDIASGNVTKTIDVGDQPDEVVVTPDSTRVYVNNHLSGTVSVIDVASGTVTKNIPVELHPSGIAIDRNGIRVYVTNGGSNTVSVIDVASGTVIKSIPVGVRPNGVAATPDGLRVYVTNDGSDTVSVIDVASGTVTKSIPVDDRPDQVAIAPNGLLAYVTNGGARTVSVIDVGNDAVTDFIPLDDRPGGVAVAPDSRRAYITNIDSGTVSVIEVASRVVINFIHVGDGPRGVAVTLDGRRVYVANYDSGDVSVIEISGG